MIDSGLIHTCAAPDVCKTPTAAGPTPVPYVNVARSGDLAKGSKRVKIEGKSVAHARSNIATSAGDEPGTAGGGLVSNKTKGKLTWAALGVTYRPLKDTLQEHFQQLVDAGTFGSRG